MNHGAAMRHGKARLCRAECPPHFLFVLPKRKRAGHGTKEKTLRDDLTPPCQITQNGGWPSRTSDKIQKSPTGCAVPIPPGTVSPHQKARRIPVFQTGRPLLLFPLPLPAPRFPSLGGVSKGGPCPRPSSLVPLGVGFQRRGPRPPAFVSFQGGAGGNRNPPAFLFRGAGGRYSLFKREYPPWLLASETGAALCGSRETGPPFTLKAPSPCPDMGMSPCGSSPYLLNLCFNSYSKLMASIGVSVSG